MKKKRSKNWVKARVDLLIPLVGNHTDENSVLKSLGDALCNHTDENSVLKSLGDALLDFSNRIPETHPQIGSTIYVERRMDNGGILKSDEWDGGEATAKITWEIVKE